MKTSLFTQLVRGASLGRTGAPAAGPRGEGAPDADEPQVAVHLPLLVVDAGAQELASALLGAPRILDVPVLIRELGPYRRWADPRLRTMLAASDPDSPERLRAALALLPVDDRVAPELATRLTRADSDEFVVICVGLQGVADRSPVIAHLWNDATDPRRSTTSLTQSLTPTTFSLTPS